jgi:hypothetical protein
MYNIYNAAGTVAAVAEMGLGLDAGLEAIANFKCGFGRMENFALGQKGAKMMLVKNPAGRINSCNSSFGTVRNFSADIISADSRLASAFSTFVHAVFCVRIAPVTISHRLPDLHGHQCCSP